MSDRPPLPYDYMPEVPSFDVRSDDVAHEEMMGENHVFDDWGMTGGNISPSLSWSGFPAETKSFAVTSPGQVRTDTMAAPAGKPVSVWPHSGAPVLAE